jgi:hypothetical protein
MMITASLSSSLKVKSDGHFGRKNVEQRFRGFEMNALHHNSQRILRFNTFSSQANGSTYLEAGHMPLRLRVQ